MTTPGDYSARSAAVRAARAALGSDTSPGIDFNVTPTGKRWVWTEIPPRAPKGEIRAESVPGEADHFRLNEAGRKAVAEARAAKPKMVDSGAGAAADVSARDEAMHRAADEFFGSKRLSAKLKSAMEAAQTGELPHPPDFTAETHKRWRPRLAEVVALAVAGDLKGLRRYQINPVSTSPKAIARYRDLSVIALEARKKAH